MRDPNANPNLGDLNPDMGQGTSQGGSQGGSQMQDATSAYGSLDSDKRSLVAQAFIQRLASKKDDPQAQQYGALDPKSVAPELLADMHRYTAQNHPQVLSEVLQHPAVTDHLGDFASGQLGQLGQGLGQMGQGIGQQNPMGQSDQEEQRNNPF